MHLPSIGEAHLLVGPSYGALGPSHLGLEGLYCVTVLLSDVFLDMFFKYYYGIAVLLRLAEGALIRRFKPCEDALGMKHVFTR